MRQLRVNSSSSYNTDSKYLKGKHYKKDNEGEELNSLNYKNALILLKESVYKNDNGEWTLKRVLKRGKMAPDLSLNARKILRFEGLLFQDKAHFDRGESRGRVFTLTQSAIDYLNSTP